MSHLGFFNVRFFFFFFLRANKLRLKREYSFRALVFIPSQMLLVSPWAPIWLQWISEKQRENHRVGAVPWCQTPVPHQDKGAGEQQEGPGAQGGGGAGCAALLRHHLTRGCSKIHGILSPARHIPGFPIEFPFFSWFSCTPSAWLAREEQVPAAGCLSTLSKFTPGAERGSLEVWSKPSSPGWESSQEVSLQDFCPHLLLTPHTNTHRNLHLIF